MKGDHFDRLATDKSPLWIERHPNPSGLPIGTLHPWRGAPIIQAAPTNHAELHRRLLAVGLPGIRWVPSPNYSPGRNGHHIGWTQADPSSWLVVHTMVGWMAATISAFQSVARQASSTWAVGLDGSLVQFVLVTNGPWTNGTMQGVGSNLDSETIEFEDGGNFNGPRTPQMYAAGAILLAWRSEQTKIPLVHRGVGGGVLGHKECYGSSTACPDGLDRDRLIREGVIYLAGGNPYPITPPPTPTPGGEEEEMVYVTDTTPKAATIRVFTSGSAYRERFIGAGASRTLSAGVSINATGFAWSDHPVQSPDLGAGVAGPDYVWWKTDQGDWCPDAILDTTGLAGAPAPGLPTTGLKSLFVLRDEVVAGGPADDDSGLAAQVAAAQLTADTALATAKAIKVPTKVTSTLS